MVQSWFKYIDHPCAIKSKHNLSICSGRSGVTHDLYRSTGEGDEEVRGKSDENMPVIRGTDTFSRVVSIVFTFELSEMKVSPSVASMLVISSFKGVLGALMASKNS